MLRWGDYSNVEGRLNAWFAGEGWKLRAFEAYDRGEGPDLYRVTGGRILGKLPEDLTRNERQAYGKIPELAQGYQGSVGAYAAMAATYLVKPADVAEVALPQASEGAIIKARQAFTPERSYGLPERTWTGIKVVVDGWREANPMIVKSWRELEDAAIEACANVGMVVPVLGGKVSYGHQHGYLWCRLPSGKVLAYPSAHIRWVDSGFVNADGSKRMKRQVIYLGVDSQTKRWGRQALYGGSQCNHVVQGTAREVLRCGMLRLTHAGYGPLVLTVHDEALAETPDGFGSLQEFLALLAQKELWYADLPLAVSGGEGRRYGK